LNPLKPFHYALLFLVVIVLASITWILPWAQATFQVGSTDELLTLPVSFWDKSLRVDGCMRGQAAGLSAGLDAWIWTGRVAFGVQLGISLLFTVSAFLRRRFRIVAIWSAGLVGLLVFFMLLTNPIRECLYAVFPPPLTFTEQWHVSTAGVLAMIACISCVVWITASILKMTLREPAFQPS
jgi:hypothetical protein